MYNQQTPIDIHCSKLVDWLVQRRHCKRDWGENLATIRRKIKSAIKDMPESDDIKMLLVGSKLDYFKSRQIVDILKTTEANSKNIFGYYSSQRMKDWQDIVYSYERDCIYLAEISTDLIRETSYEIPGIRRSIQKLQKDKEEAEKEKANLLRRQQQFNSEYQRLALAYGIKGVNIIDELNEQSKSLAHVMVELTNLSKGLWDGLRYYRDHTKSITKLDSTQFLPTLDHIINRGNTTVYELIHQESPEKIELEGAASSSSGGTASEIELVNDEIDFGEEAPSSSESSSGFVHVDGKIDDTFIDVRQVVCDSGDKVARGEQAKLVLEARKTRNQFLNNLYELDAFFKQIIAEESNESTSRIDKKEADRFISIIKKIFDIVNKEKNRVLFQMSDCPGFIESVSDKFVLKSKQAMDSFNNAEQVQDRIRDIENQIREAEIHLKKAVSASKLVQGKVEESISSLYNGRPINIMGCVS